MIIVDVQNKNLSIHSEGHKIRLGAGMSDEERSEIIENILSLEAAMRAHGFPVIYLRNAYGRDRNETARAKMAQRRGDLFPAEDFLHVEGTWGVEIIDELKPQP